MFLTLVFTGRYIGLPVEERICLEVARAPLLHFLNLHHMDSGAVSDKDKFITIMQNPDSRTAKLLYNVFKTYIMTMHF